VKKKNIRYGQMIGWTDMQTWKSYSSRRSFGTAVYILAHRKCRDEADYYFALRGLLGLTTPDDMIAKIVSGDTFPAYLSTASHALATGDYTPLLMIPPRDEVVDERASWLHGHSVRRDFVWDLGICHKRGTNPLILHEGDQGQISAEVEVVGVIEEFEYFDFECDNAAKTALMFCEVARKIIKRSGLSAPAFCAAVERCFPRPQSKALHTQWSSVEQRLQKPKPNYHTIGKLIKQFADCNEKNDNDGTLAASRSLIGSLGLDEVHQEIGTTPLKQAFTEAAWYLDRGHDRVIGLARVRCNACGGRFLFRILMWYCAPEPEAAQVYRIPGLLCDMSVPGGIGIIVSKTRVIGRMDYGTRACECRKTEVVEIH
jgi:hypothetical protein